MKRYPLVVTPGTQLYECQHGRYGKVICTAPSVLTPTRQTTGTILELCGKPLMSLDSTKHNGFSWFLVREDVTVADFDVTYRHR